MSWSINLPVLKTQDRPLKDGVHDRLLANADVDKDFQVSIPGGTFQIAAALKAQVELLNEASDEDKDGILGKPSAQPGPTELPALFLPGEAGCWLKYSTEGKAKADGSGQFPFVSVEGKAAVDVRVADYRRHDPSLTLAKAIQGDVRTLRLAFMLPDVKAMGPGDVLAMQTGLQLSTAIKLTWPDFLATAATALASQALSSKLLTLKASLGPSVAFSVSTADEYRIVFSRPLSGGAFSVSIHRASAHSVAPGFSLGVKAEIGAPVLEALLKAVAGSHPAAQVEAFVKGLESNSLAKEWLPLGSELFAKLGFQVETSVESISQAYQKAKEILSRAAEHKVSIAFQYEYSRLTREAALMELEIPSSEIDRAHGPLVSGRIDAIQAMTQDSWIRRYFNQKTAVMTRAWGFTLGWRDWSLVKTKERTKLEVVVQHASRDHVHGSRRYAYLGTRSYEAEGWLQRHPAIRSIDFKADMKQFSLSPSADEFEYGFYGQFRTEGKLGKDELKHLIDRAIVLRVIPESDSAEVLQQLQTASAEGKALTTRLEFKLEGESFFTLLQNMGVDPSFEREAYARALARALPYSSQPVRSSVQGRQKLYAPLWLSFLKSGGRDWSYQLAPGIVAHHLKQTAGKEGWMAAEWEESKGSDGHYSPGTFMSVLEKDSINSGDIGGKPYAKIAEDWRDLNAQVRALQDAIEGADAFGGDPTRTVIQEVFDAFDRPASNSFRLMALANWLLELAERDETLRDVQRLLSVTVGEGDSAQVLTFTSA
jgi:hypothetical protein